MADVNPTVTVEQHSRRAASQCPAVMDFPLTVTLQVEAAVLKRPLCSNRGVRHNCTSASSQKPRVKGLTVVSAEGRLCDTAAVACGVQD